MPSLPGHRPPGELATYHRSFFAARGFKHRGGWLGKCLVWEIQFGGVLLVTYSALVDALMGEECHWCLPRCELLVALECVLPLNLPRDRVLPWDLSHATICSDSTRKLGLGWSALTGTTY